MPLDIPLPSEYPQTDPSQYVPLLLSAIGGFLQSRDVWEAADYEDAYGYMEELKTYIVDLMLRGEIMPIGKIDIWLADVPPDGWVILDGHAISREVYADLFALWGTLYGAGNGTTTFNVPDFGERLPMGVGGIMGLGETLGALSHTIAQANLPNVNFTVTDPGHTHDQRVGNNLASNRSVGGSGTNQATQTQPTTSTTRLTTDTKATGITVNSGGSGNAIGHLNPVLGVHFIAWTGVITPP